MNLANKRFWFFECATVFYAIVLMLAGMLVWGKTSAMEMYPIIAGLCLVAGLITWLVANGRHWFVFGLIYEAFFLLLTALLVIFNSITDGYNLANDFAFDLMILSIYLFTIAVVCFIPSMALAFVGYHLLRKTNDALSMKN